MPRLPEGELDIPESLVRALGRSRSAVVLSGAGMSAESGVPTFRDALDGLWSRETLHQSRAFRPEDLATPEAFAGHPRRVWSWYRWRRELAASVEPNAGHRALSAMAGILPGLRVVTQNVDGLHQRAGSERVLELHGNLFVDLCSANRRHDVAEAPAPVGDDPPPCPHCGAPIRPGVVWFGELLPADTLNDARALAAECDVFMSIGTSALVSPAADLAFIALESGATVIEINPETTNLTARAHYAVRGPSGSVLPELQERLRAHRAREEIT